MEPQPISYATPARRGQLTPVADVVGLRTAAGAAWLAGVLAAAGYAVGVLYDQQQALAGTSITALGSLVGIASLAGTVAGPAAFAVTVGGSAALILYDWSTFQLVWVAALPVVAGCGLAWAVIAEPYGHATLLSAVVPFTIQGGLVYAGTHLGRPVGRWLARRLVPPPLRASLVALWS